MGITKKAHSAAHGHCHVLGRHLSLRLFGYNSVLCVCLSLLFSYRERKPSIDAPSTLLCKVKKERLGSKISSPLLRPISVFEESDMQSGSAWGARTPTPATHLAASHVTTAHGATLPEQREEARLNSYYNDDTYGEYRQLCSGSNDGHEMVGYLVLFPSKSPQFLI